MKNSLVKINYFKQTVYLIMIGLITLFLGYTIWGMLHKPAASSSILEVSNVEISKIEAMADGKDFSVVTITVADKEDLNEKVVAPNVWVGLNIADSTWASPNLSNAGWYSPETGRSFYQTDDKGEVIFKIKSNIVGNIVYRIYTATPEQKNNGKYQYLGREFAINFK